MTATKKKLSNNTSPPQCDTYSTTSHYTFDNTAKNPSYPKHSRSPPTDSHYPFLKQTAPSQTTDWRACLPRTTYQCRNCGVCILSRMWGICNGGMLNGSCRIFRGGRSVGDLGPQSLAAEVLVELMLFVVDCYYLNRCWLRRGCCLLVAPSLLPLPLSGRKRLINVFRCSVQAVQCHDESATSDIILLLPCRLLLL